MKQLRRFVKRGTALIPVEIRSLQQNKTFLVMKSHPLTEYLFYRGRRLFTLLVLLPWIVAATYIFFIESPIYESTSRILIEKDTQNDPTNISMGLLSNGNAPSSEIYLTREYIVSRELLNFVEKKIAIKKEFQKTDIDFLSRLSPNASQNEFLKYYRHRVGAVIDPETNEIIITSTAFTPKEAKRLLNAIIIETKQFVNRVSNTMAKKQYDFAKLNLHLAKEKLFQAGKDVIEWQNKNGLFDPKETAQVVSSVMAKLKGTLVEKQTEFITYSSFMQPDSNKVVTLQEEIDALKAQIENQTNLLLGKKEKNGKLNRIMSDFEWIQLQSKFAQAEYQAAQQAYDAAAFNMAKNQNLVIVIEKPNLPDEPAGPVAWFDLTNLLFFLLVIFVLVKMGIVIVKEHID